MFDTINSHELFKSKLILNKILEPACLTPTGFKQLTYIYIKKKSISEALIHLCHNIPGYSLCCNECERFMLFCPGTAHFTDFNSKPPLGGYSLLFKPERRHSVERGAKP